MNYLRVFDVAFLSFVLSWDVGGAALKSVGSVEGSAAKEISICGLSETHATVEESATSLSETALL